MDPLIASALISAGTNIAGGILGSFGQSSANKTNIKLQQMQNDFNERMWRQNNEYNDPSNQMKRLINAGISPTLAAQTVEGGISNSPAQGANPATVQNTMLPLQEGISNATSSMAQMYSTISQANLNETNAKNSTLLTMAEVALKGKQAGLAGAQKVYQDIINKFQTERSSLENKLLRKQITKLQADVNETWSRYHLNRSQERLNEATKKQVELNTKLLPELTSAQIFSLRTQAIAAFKNAVINEQLAPYQKQQLIANANLICNQAFLAKSDGDIKKLEVYISKKLGIPLSYATQLTGQLTQTIGSLSSSLVSGILSKIPSFLP